MATRIQPQPAATIAAPAAPGTGVPARHTPPGSAGTSAFPGRPLPVGARPDAGGTNFSVYADASAVDLCLVDAAGAQYRQPMQERTFGLWHTYVPGVGPGTRYGYRIASGDDSKILLDPWARRVDSTYYDLLAASAQGLDTLGKVPLGMVADSIRSTVPGPGTPWEHTVIYEAHVRGLTTLHPAIPADLQGTFAGVASPAIIDHLHRLGVTALELMPVFAFASEPGLVATGRRNYWGYAPLAFSAPHPRYATRPGQELPEFVAMVDTLHREGIEVILDVVYNHTCEGEPAQPVDLSWRGLGTGLYYLPNLADITGTGNTLDSGRLPVIRMVVDSLRYWAQDLGVDGFRFDLASVLGRPHGGAFDAGSALLSAIAVDPVLSTRKLIAEPWDATGDGYAMGRFSAEWAEWNDHFRDTMRDYWRGVGTLADLGYRLSGSQDLFGAGRRPFASINFITAHDGFTLRDAVSYANKHNDANGEGNRDGTDNNRSANYGVEGETGNAAIIATRRRQARNLLASLLLSTGTPMIAMGDEMWRTQGGNNNAYCQDNATSWVDWTGLVDDTGQSISGTAESDMVGFVSRALAIRKDSPALRQGEFFEGRAPAGGDGVADLVWFTTSGVPMATPDWFDSSRRTLLMWVDGRDVRGHTTTGGPVVDDSWLLALHSGPDPIEITLPGEPYGSAFQIMLDTSDPTGAPPAGPHFAAGEQINLPARTVWLLRAYRDDDPPEVIG